MFGYKKRLFKKVKKEIVNNIRSKIFQRLEDYRVKLFANARKDEVKLLDYFMAVINDAFEEYLKEK